MRSLTGGMSWGNRDKIMEAPHGLTPRGAQKKVFAFVGSGVMMVAEDSGMVVTALRLAVLAVSVFVGAAVYVG